MLAGGRRRKSARCLVLRIPMLWCCHTNPATCVCRAGCHRSSPLHRGCSTLHEDNSQLKDQVCDTAIPHLVVRPRYICAPGSAAREDLMLLH